RTWPTDDVSAGSSSPVSTRHRRTVPLLLLPAVTRAPSGEKARHRRDSPARAERAFTSHRRIVPSNPVEPSVAPSGEKATAVTSGSCPVGSACCRRVCGSHSRIRWSSPALASVRPSGEQAASADAGDVAGPVLDEEVKCLSEKYRQPLVLCYFEG